MGDTLTTGDKVIDFTLSELGGGQFDSGATRSTGLLMFVFWKKGCGTCRYTMPFLQRFHDIYAADGTFRIEGVSQDNAEDTRAFMEELSISFPQAMDVDLDATDAYGLVTVPGIYLVDSGNEILRHSPAFVADELNAMALTIAERQGREYVPIVRPEDEAPAIKPG